MGTPTACAYATIAFGLHERLRLLPQFKHNLIYYRRYIDDIFAIWIDLPTNTNISTPNNQWVEFNKTLNSFGTLQWKTDTPSTSVAFLDLQITLKHGKIHTATYQKPMNLFLYLPSLSAHRPNSINRLIINTILRYREQNSSKDFVRFTSQFIQ